MPYAPLMIFSIHLLILGFTFSINIAWRTFISMSLVNVHLVEATFPFTGNDEDEVEYSGIICNIYSTLVCSTVLVTWSSAAAQIFINFYLYF